MNITKTTKSTTTTISPYLTDLNDNTPFNKSYQCTQVAYYLNLNQIKNKI